MSKYYYAGTHRIAMRENGVLSYLISDHLGSTSMVTDASGAVINQTKYKAWGEIRYSSGTNPTDYTYTGQYSYTSDFGLMFYNARWYDPSLGRFTSADTIVPLQQGVQAWDRYAYVNNSPVNYTDPTGHAICNEDGNCNDGSTIHVEDYTNNNTGNGGGNTNWPDVADDLSQEADDIRNDLAGELLDELIGQGISMGAGLAIGFATKCPVAKQICATAGGVAGFFSAFFIASASNATRTSEANTYDAIASAILQGMDGTSSEIEIQIEHHEEVNINLNSPFLITDDFTIPEYYVLSVNGAEEPVAMLPSEYDAFISIVNLNTGP